MKKIAFFSISGLMLIGAVILRYSATLFSRDYWYDEAFTGILLKAPWGKMNQMIFADVHPPLYYWLTKLWAAPLAYSPAGIRSFSVAMGIATIISLLYIGRRMFNTRAALMAAALTAFSPFAIEYSQEARMYALFGLLMLWSMWFFYRALQTNEKKYWIWWGVFAGLSFYTHYLSLFFFVLFYVAHVVYKFSIFNFQFSIKSQIQNNKAQKKKKLPATSYTLQVKQVGLKLMGTKGFWIGVGIIGVFFVSWIKIFIRHISKGNLGWIEPAQFSDLPKTLQIFFFGHPSGTGGVPWSNEFKYFFDGTSVGLLILAVMVTLLTIAMIRKIKTMEFTLLAILSFGTLIFLIFLSHGIDIHTEDGIKNICIKLYVARYFMPAAVYVYLLFAGLITEVIGKRWIWVTTLGVYALLLMMLKPLTFSSGWNTVYENQQVLFPSGELIVASNAFDYSTARYYFGEDRVRYYNKNNPTEDFSGWVVVGNHNRITELSEIKNNAKYVVVDGNCQWDSLNVIEEQRVGDQLSVCRFE